MKLYNDLRNLLYKINYSEKDLFALSLAFVLTALNITISWLFSTGSTLALPLICICVSPLYILAFRAGVYYAVISTICSFILLCFIKGFLYSFIQIMLLWAPALAAIALLSINKVQENGRVKYMPLPQIFFSLIMVNNLIIITILSIILHNPANVAFLKELINNQLNYISDASANLPSSMQLHFLEVKSIILNNFLKILACLVSIYNIVFMLSNLYVGLSISHKFKLIPQKGFYWPKDLRLPIGALLIFIIAILITISNFSALLSLYSIVVLSSIAIAFFMCGVAYWHDVTRRVKYRFLILLLTYIGLLTSFTSLPLCCTILLMGMWSAIKHYKSHKYIL